MTLELDDIVFRTRALAQTHPFGPRAQAFVNRLAPLERAVQPVPEMGDWAVHAVTVGYCLRRVEEIDTGHPSELARLDGEDLEERSRALAEALRVGESQEVFLYPEQLVIDALDRLIAGEARRRLGRDAHRDLDPDALEALEEYIASWTVRGYALRVAERTDLGLGV
jgi:hypothetical protein